jgi:TRAP-type C4-dicarboxylate transport system permease small subunit
MLTLLDKFRRGLSLGGAYLSSILLVILVALIMTEIIGRSFFDYSTMLADEYSGYLYLAVVFFGLAFTFESDAHIRINLVTSRLGKKAQRFMDVFAGILSTSVMLFALYYCWLYMVDSHTMGMLSEGVSETPLYLAQIPMPIGLGLFALASFVFTIKRIFNDI